jgi:hypothetical protein
MAKTFLPKSVNLSEKVIEKLKKDFNVFDLNIRDIRYWNDSKSPFSGTVIDPEGQYLCYPYAGSGEEEFLKDYPGGEIFRA